MDMQVINTFFLVWIMVIVLSKLRSRTALDHDRRHYKAAKALVISYIKKPTEIGTVCVLGR